MARNFAVKKVRKQMYPATYNFMDDADAAVPSGWTQVTATGVVAASWQSHKKVFKCTSAGGGSSYRFYQQFTAQEDGDFEFWFGSTDCTNAHSLYFGKTSSVAAANLATRIYTWADVLYANHGDGVGGITAVNMGALTDNTIAHVRVHFDSATDTFSVWRDGTNYIDAENFYNDNTFAADELDTITLYGPNVASAIGYWDAFGFSWDTDYNIGDNVFWRHYKESTDEFEGDDVGTQGTSITWVDSVDTAASTVLVQEFNEHKKILRQDYTSAAGGYDYCQHTFATQAKASWFAFWIKAADITGSNQIRLNEDATLISNFAIRTSQFQKYSGGAWSQVTGSPVPVNDTWYLIYLKITDAATDTIDCWIGNILYETYNAQANETAGVNNVQIRSYGVGEYVYIDAPISSLDSDSRGDNRLFDYNDSYTREDITTLVKNVLTTNILHVWRTGTLYSETVYYYDEVFFQIYDVNSKLGMEADLTNRIQHDSLYHYPLQDKNADDLVNESSNTFAADDIHDPTDSTSMLKVILPNVSEADGDLILVDADTKTDTYSPVTKNYPDYMMLRDISDLSDSVVIIAANGKCYLDDDKDSGDSLDLDTAADKLIMTRPPIPNDIVGVNYFVIKGAMNLLTGTRFSKIVDNSGSDKKNTFRITNIQLRSQADVDAYAAKIAAKLIAVKEIIIETQGLGAHNMGETFNYKYVNAVHNIPQKDYYIIKEDFNYDLAAATIKLSEGLSEKSKYAQRFERTEDFNDSYAAQIYEVDLITVMLNLYPSGGASDHYNGVDTIKSEDVVGNFYLGDDIDDDKDVILDFVFMNAAHGARTTDGILNVTKFDTDGSYTTAALVAGVSFDAVFSENSGLFHISRTLAASDIEADHAYRVVWTNDETDNGNATTCYVASIQVKYYRKLGG